MSGGYDEDTLEPVLMRYKLVMDPRVIEQDYRTANTYEQHMRMSKMLVYQLTRLTTKRHSLRHDDRLDALAVAVGYWSEQMATDEQRGIDSACCLSCVPSGCWVDQRVDHQRALKGTWAPAKLLTSLKSGCTCVSATRCSQHHNIRQHGVMVPRRGTLLQFSLVQGSFFREVNTLIINVSLANIV